MGRLLIPYLSPLNWVDAQPADIPQYLSKFMDDYLQRERLTEWEQTPMGYFVQPWIKSDVITHQIQSNIGQPVMKVIDCQQHVYLTSPMTQLQQNQFDPSYFIYENNISLAPLQSGIYFMRMDAGNKTWVSEGFDLEDTYRTSLLLQFTNRKFYGDIVFETGIMPSIRITGFIKLKTPASKDTLYEDQILDMVMVRSRPYRIFQLTIIGVPDWMIDKLNWILGCSSVKYDGHYFVKNEGSKFEESDVVGYGATKSYTIEMREATARNGKIYDNVENPNESLTIILNTTSKGFADTSNNGSSDIVQFLDVE